MKTIIRNGIEVPADVDWMALDCRRELQLRAMAAVVKKFEEEGLTYYLAYGCLIGLMRHNGQMIPWDDDVDLIMPRADYEKAISVLMADDNFRTFEFTRCADFRVKSAKVAIAKEVANVPKDAEKFCYVDIFALDKEPANRAVKFLKWQLRVILENIVLAKQGISTGVRKIIGRLASVVLPRDAATIHRVMIRLTSMSLNGMETWTNDTVVGELYGAYGDRCMMPWRVYNANGAKYAEFEGVRVRIPGDVEAYLEHCYGNWRKMPPVEERRPRHACDDPWFYSEVAKQ